MLTNRPPVGCAGGLPDTRIEVPSNPGTKHATGSVVSGLAATGLSPVRVVRAGAGADGVWVARGTAADVAGLPDAAGRAIVVVVELLPDAPHALRATHA